MRIFKNGNQWNGLVGLLLGVAAILGCLNSVLQLSRFGFSIGDQFSNSEWMQIGFWLVLLVVWVMVLGLILGFYSARQWYGTGAEEGSMAPSD